MKSQLGHTGCSGQTAINSPYNVLGSSAPVNGSVPLDSLMSDINITVVFPLSPAAASVTYK